MIRLLYTLASFLCTPYVLVYLLIRGLKDTAYLKRWPERFGFVPGRIQPHNLWFHAVSAGEVLAAVPLIESLLDDNEDCRILVTTTTPTGSDEVMRRLGSSVSHCYAPYDTPGSVRRFLRKTQPQALFLVETELWPHMVLKTSRAGAPVYLINARLSEQSARGYAKLRDLTDSVLASIEKVACQYEDSAHRFERLGVPREKISVTGNVKFDVKSPPPLDSHIQDKASLLSATSRNIWIAGSTHPGEEDTALKAHREVCKSFDDSVLVLAPRHTQRVDEVLKLCQSLELKASTIESFSADVEVVVVDRMGILFPLYKYARVAFIGGSLQGTGGHNPIEAAYYGVPIVMGPDRHNFNEICKKFEEAGCLTSVRNSYELALAITSLLDDANTRKLQSDHAREVVAQNQGALPRLRSQILEWLDRPVTSQTSN